MRERHTLPRLAGRAYVGLVLFFLYAPILVMAVMSFNASQFYAFPLDFTLDVEEMQLPLKGKKAA